DEAVVILALVLRHALESEVLFRCVTLRDRGSGHSSLRSTFSRGLVSSYPKMGRATIRIGSRLYPSSRFLGRLGRWQRHLRRTREIPDQRADLVLGKGRPEVLGHHRLLALPALGDLALGQGDGLVGRHERDRVLVLGPDDPRQHPAVL